MGSSVAVLVRVFQIGETTSVDTMQARPARSAAVAFAHPTTLGGNEAALEPFAACVELGVAVLNIQLFVDVSQRSAAADSVFRAVLGLAAVKCIGRLDRDDGC